LALFVFVVAEESRVLSFEDTLWNLNSLLSFFHKSRT
jgi:hypothetical protein